MKNIKSLRDIQIDKEVIIESVDCEENIKRRILDLGIIKGTKIKSVFRSPLGDPIAYEVRGSLISLREEESCKIRVNTWKIDIIML